VITLGCDKKLPAICAASITEVSGQFSGSGESDHILVSVNESLQPLSDSHNVVFGTSLKLNCSCNEGLEVKWYINGKVDPFGSESVLELVFTFPGVYRCEAAGGEMDKAINKSVTLCGVDGQPGDIEILSAASYSQTELEVSWSPPKFLGTRDPLLLRYTVYYTSEDILDENSEVQLVIPQLEEHFVTVKLSNLSKGTSYLIGVVATSMKISTKLPTVITVAPTYGEAPTKSVPGLTFQPSENDERTLIALWEKPDYFPPEGPVSFYRLQYRDGQQALPNEVYIPSHLTFFTLHGVTIIKNYEVRVAVLVEVNRKQYSSSPWTEWVGVTEGKDEPTTEKGEVKPTTAGERTEDIDVIVSAILVPLAILVIIILILSTCLYFFYCGKEKQSYAVHKLGLSESPEVNKLTSTVM
jgi:hypothetical protein